MHQTDPLCAVERNTKKGHIQVYGFEAYYKSPSDTTRKINDLTRQ